MANVAFDPLGLEHPVHPQHLGGVVVRERWLSRCWRGHRRVYGDIVHVPTGLALVAGVQVRAVAHREVGVGRPERHVVGPGGHALGNRGRDCSHPRELGANGVLGQRGHRNDHLRQFLGVARISAHRVERFCFCFRLGRLLVELAPGSGLGEHLDVRGDVGVERTVHRLGPVPQHRCLHPDGPRAHVVAKRLRLRHRLVPCGALVTTETRRQIVDPRHVQPVDVAGEVYEVGERVVELGDERLKLVGGDLEPVLFLVEMAGHGERPVVGRFHQQEVVVQEEVGQPGQGHGGVDDRDFAGIKYTAGTTPPTPMR